MDADVTLAAGLVGGAAGALLGAALLVRSLGRTRKAVDQRLDRIEHMLTAPTKRGIGPRQGSVVDEVEPRIRELLAAFPTMPATVIAERIGWSRG